MRVTSGVLRSWGIVVLLAADSAPAVLAADTSGCDRDSIDRASWRLTTRGVALAVTQPRHDWWDSFDLGKYADDLADLNLAVTRTAERALEIDPRNMMGHSILARQYLVLSEPEQADAAWGVVMGAGGQVVWTSTYYDVDGREWFFTAVGREGLRLYQWKQIAAVEKRGTAGILEFPGPDDERFWMASGGCIDAAVVPHAFVPWSDVREIRAGNWVLWFELTKPVNLTSGRNGKTKRLDELKVAFHGRSGTLEVYKPVGEEEPALRGRGPAAYNDLVRRTIVKFVDPERRIALPALKTGVGW
jgi:hypothetical protein